MALVGYARVSSVGQSLDVQLDKLGHCDKLFEEKASGSTHARPQLTACLDYLREGDVLVVTRLDRLARSTLHLCQIASQFEENGITLRVLDQSIDTSDATGRLLFHMLAAISQFETELRKERQMDGIQKAKERGVRFGRKKELYDEQVRDLRERRSQGAMIKELMEDYQLSKATIYRYLQQEKEQVQAPLSLATFGYGLLPSVKVASKKSDIFRRCLEEEGVTLLLDTRYSPWGGYWNPKNIGEILDDSSVRYVFKEGETSWHQLLGASREIRNLEPFSVFREAYINELESRGGAELLARLASLIRDEGLVALMCCEPYTPERNNCHRFVLADLLVEQNYLSTSQIKHINMADHC